MRPPLLHCAQSFPQVGDARGLVDLSKRAVGVVDHHHVELGAVEGQRQPFDAMRLDQGADLRADAARAFGLFLVERRHGGRAAQADLRRKPRQERAIVTADLQEPLAHSHAGHRHVQRIHRRPAAPAHQHPQEKHHSVNHKLRRPRP